MRAFVDASAWIALFVEADRKNEAARRAFARLRGKTPPITSDYVIDEMLTRIATRHSRLKATEAGRVLIDEGAAEVVPVTGDDFRAAWALMRKYQDKRLSFTDCTILAQMERLRLDAIITFDGDFDKVGKTVISG